MYKSHCIVSADDVRLTKRGSVNNHYLEKYWCFWKNFIHTKPNFWYHIILMMTDVWWVLKVRKKLKKMHIGTVKKKNYMNNNFVL